MEAEYQLGLNTDARRNLDVNREISDPRHPFSILSVGTVDTLADRPAAPVREDLLTFYGRYYSANLMALAVLGNESLDELEAMVTGIFSPVPNHDVEIEDIGVPRIAPERLPLLVYIQPKATARSLSIAFAMPDYSDRYRAKPLQYIGNLLGHEGEGSLLSLLKEQGWAEALGAGSAIAYRGGSEFNISISLTEEGLKERDQVLREVFEYLQLLKDEKPRRALYEEQGQLAALAFRFRDDVQPIRYVSGLANDMQLYAPEDVLRGNYLMTDYEPELIQTILERYFVPENALIQVIAEGVPVDRESEYYKTPYSVQTLDPATAVWGTVTSDDIDPRLRLPAENEFVAEDVRVLPLPENAPAVPQLVHQGDRMRIWQRQDTRFRVPRGALYSNFLTGFVNATAADAAASELYVELLSDAVNEFTYPALLAGLNFSISTNSRGIGLNISGYNDKQMVLLEHIVDAIQSANLDTHRFDNIRTDLIRALENVKTARASSQVMRQGRRLLLTGQYPEAELIAELETLTPERVAAHAEKLWNSATIDILLNGNYAAAAAEEVRKALKPLTRHRLPVAPSPTRLVKLKSGDDLLYEAAIEHGDAVMLWYIQGPDDSESDRALAGLTGQILSADYFEELRTEQQLGYVVSAFSWPLLDVPGLGMLVQSPGSSVPSVVAASRAFLSQQAKPDALAEERFQRHQTALLKEILKPDENLWEESAYFWREINRNRLEFDSRERIADAVRSVTSSEWRAWYQQHILDRPASLIIAGPGHLGALPAAETTIEDPAAFRASRPFYERP